MTPPEKYAFIVAAPDSSNDQGKPKVLLLHPKFSIPFSLRPFQLLQWARNSASLRESCESNYFDSPGDIVKIYQ